MRSSRHGDDGGGYSSVADTNMDRLQKQQGGKSDDDLERRGRDDYSQRPPQSRPPVVPTTDEIEGVARHLDRIFSIRSYEKSKIRRGVVGFLKSRTRSSEKLASRGHQKHRISLSSEESPFSSTGSGEKGLHVSWGSHVQSSSDESSVAFVNGASATFGADRDEEDKIRDESSLLHSENLSPAKRRQQFLRGQDRSYDTLGGGHIVSQRAKKEPTDGGKTHRRHRSFELFGLPECRSRLKSVDSFFSSSPGKVKKEKTSAGRKRWSSEQCSWSFLQRIDLEGRYVDSSNPDEHIAALSQLLMHNTNILELNISWNMLSDSGVISIAGFLSVNKSLLKLDLSKNWKVGNKGGIALADALCKNSTLKTINMMNCKQIGVDAALAFATALEKNTGLTDFSLGDCRIGPLGAASIARSLSTNCTLLNINLSHNDLGVEGIRELALSLEQNASLRSIDVRSCKINDKGALLLGAALSCNSSLEEVYLCRNKIYNDGAAALEFALDKNETLVLMDLSDNQVNQQLQYDISLKIEKNKERKLDVGSDVVKANFSSSVSFDSTASLGSLVYITEAAISEGRDIMRRMSTEYPAPLPIPFEYLDNCTDGFSGDRKRGQGAFGEVFLGIDKTLRRRFAVKRMKAVMCVDNEDAARARKVFKREIEAFKCFRHPNIARLHAFFLSDDLQGPQCLVFEFAANGSLDTFLGVVESRRNLHWTTRISISHGIAKALKYLHHGDAAHFGSCFHGDIKPHNICLKKDFTPLLIDCGLSRVLPSDESEMTQSIYGSSCKHTRGTVGYICPQYAENFALGRSQSYTSSCDIYSLGIVLGELFTGVLQRSKVDGEEFHVFDRYSEDGRLKMKLEADADEYAGSWQLDHRRKFATLAMTCIRKDPAKRPSISDVEGQLSSLSSSSKPWTSGQKNSLAFLFSNPLAWMDTGGVLHPVAKLSINREMDLVQQCVRDSNRDIKLSFDAATCCRLQELVSARYGCLHFAGHGMPSSTLVFEDGVSGCEFVSADDLFALIPHREPFKFVFVAACHSEYIGKAFVDAGVKHVLCCEHEAELLDDAAARFTRSFYGSLCNGYTIKHAFEAGVGAVTVRHTTQESKKFILLPECEDHDVPVFDAAELEWEEERVPQQHISSPVVFEGREIVMHQVISTILSRRRLVTLLGKNGVGRSSLALAIAGYIQERLRSIRHIENIIYVQRRKDESKLVSLVQPLMDQLVSIGLAEEEKLLETGSSLPSVCRALRNAKALIIFDDIDGIEETAKFLLQVLYEKASKVQVLCVAHRPINLISGAIIEKCITVGPLDLTSSAKLFGKVCPFADTGPKREMLSSSLLCRESSSGSTAPRKNSEGIVDTIHEGFPTEIIKAAKSMSEDDFHDLTSCGLGSG